MSTKPESVLTRYRLTWSRADGTGKERTVECFVDSADLARPGDMDELKLVVRKILANRYLPIGDMNPENVLLQDLMPICNCEDPSPGKCSYAEHRGHRFYLASSSRPGYEVVMDHHREKMLGTVCISLSVEFLTLVQMKHGHQ
ncbi:hypothetical protein [Streptomyces sp. 061-3]|uniref:hypothetical protein n=1 Tax=Streptomyces sp. 061-3 TaxID=2789268 RepID=UPI00397EFD04